jgi:O-methyltransferase/aklanonic acid methyltransferase
MSERNTGPFVRDIAGVFGRAARTYGRVGQDLFGYFGGQVVNLAEVRPGCSLLDVGCGTGAALVRAADLVAATAPVIGIDLSPGMLVQARGALASAGLTAEVMVADAQHTPFRDHVFDVVVSSFAFAYFPSPQQAATEMRRVLRPGGRLGVCFSDKWWFQDDPAWRWHEELLVTIGVPLGTSGLRQPTPLVRLLEEAGFHLTSVATETFPLRWADAQEWWEWCWSHGYRDMLERLPGPRLAEYRKRCFERLRRGPIDGRLEILVALGQ